MRSRVLRRAATAALTLMLLTTMAAMADSIPADGDADTIGNQQLIDLGEALPGETISLPVAFSLTCVGLNHVAPGATITLDLSDMTIPEGSSAVATTATIGPVPDDWTLSGEGCPEPAPTVLSNEPSTVTLTMPTTPGPKSFTLFWSRLGATGLTGSSVVTIQVEVVPNTPPSLQLPADMTVEATSAAGAVVTWTASATDAEDGTPPTPVCDPASGSTLALGPTTVECSVTDGGGMTDTGSFVVDVVDTTAPGLAGVPGNRSITTGDPTGTTLTFDLPTADDLVDPNPTVSCVPASGTKIPVGTTTVTCTATDDAGNTSSGSFTVDVTYVSPVVWTARWGEPVTTGSALVANLGRTIPIKVEVFADGVEQVDGEATLGIATCAGVAVGTVDLAWDGGRWTAHLDTSALGGPGCYVAKVGFDGNMAGSFRIDLRGDATPASNGNPKTKR